MRKWLWIGTVSVALGGIGGSWYFIAKTTNTNRDLDDVNRVVVKDKEDGDAESSDEIEPLFVDRGNPSGVPSLEAAVDEGPMPRVVLEPGMKQPPRPDSEPGRIPRMPYADEEEILAVTLDPIKLILESTLPRLGIFEEIDKANPADESENKGANSPTAEPQAAPPMNYHQQHCPRYGHCPAPYYDRPAPRD